MCTGCHSSKTGAVDGIRSIEKRKISWKELWGMEARISFLLRANYDVLPLAKIHPAHCARPQLPSGTSSLVVK